MTDFIIKKLPYDLPSNAGLALLRFSVMLTGQQ